MVVVRVDRVARHAEIHRPQRGEQELVRHSAGKVDEIAQAKLVAKRDEVVVLRAGAHQQ